MKLPDVVRRIETMLTQTEHELEHLAREYHMDPTLEQRRIVEEARDDRDALAIALEAVWMQIEMTTLARAESR